MTREIVSGVVMLLVVVTASGVRAQRPPTVQLGSCNGLEVVGTWTSVASGENQSAAVAQFKGIPFAAPPVGALRFRATVDLTCPPALLRSLRIRQENETNGLLFFNATTFSEPCVQIAPSGVGTVGSEDCLYLNVYVPAAVVSRPDTSKLAPVLVYIHGGGLITGSGIWEPLQFLSAFASGQDDVPPTFSTSAVVVTINYRLGTLGFLASQSMCDESGDQSICGNYGILDQLSALRWVQANIEAFGGDRRRVSIMGQSSGGTSVFALMASKMSAGLFHAGISLSGSPNMTMPRSTKLQQDAPFIASLGCADASTQMSCLRNISAADLQSSLPNAYNTPALFTNQFLNNGSSAGEAYAALVYADGVVLESDGPFSAMSRGINSNVTLVFGSMGQECNLVSPNPDDVTGLSQAAWSKFLAQRTFASWPRSSDVGNIVYDLYQRASLVNPQLAYDSINADYGLTCASWTIAQQLRSVPSNVRTAKTYIYMNQQGPDAPSDPNGVQAYAYHTWDYVNACHNWGSYVPTDVDRALSRLQRSQWFSVWSNSTIENWPDISQGDASATFFLFSHEDKYPFRATGSTTDPFNSPNVCPFLVNSLGMDARYWWCN